MTNQTISLITTSGILIGAGAGRLESDLNTALILIGAGVALQLIVGVLQKFGVPVSTPPQG